MSPTRGWLSSVEPNLHFGIGDGDSIHSIKVIWPGGKTQLLKNIQSNSSIILDWKKATLPEKKPNKPSKTLFKKRNVHGIAFSHQENTYNDFKYERLMPP